MSPADAALPTRAEAETWDVSHLESAAQRWRSEADKSEQLFGQHVRNLQSPGGTEWTGTAAEAAVERGHADLAMVRRQGDVLREAGTIAGNGAQDQRAMQRALLDAISEAEQDGFKVNDDLSVTDTRKTDKDGKAARQAVAQQHTDYIRWRAAQLIAGDDRIGQQLHTKAAELQQHKFDGHDGVQAVDYTRDHTPGDPGLPQPPGGWSSDPATEEAQRIAYGHAWKEHQGDFVGMTQPQLAEKVHEMMTGNPKADPDLHVGTTPRGSTVMYKDGLAVIYDSKNPDSGTVFKPPGGYNYFLNATRPGGVPGLPGAAAGGGPRGGAAVPVPPPAEPAPISPRAGVGGGPAPDSMFPHPVNLPHQHHVPVAGEPPDEYPEPEL